MYVAMPSTPYTRVVICCLAIFSYSVNNAVMASAATEIVWSYPDENVTLDCDYEDLLWARVNLSTFSSSDIFTYGRVVDRWAEKYGSAPNRLVVKDVQQEDTGLYSCMEHNGVGNLKKNTLLVVQRRLDIITLSPASATQCNDAELLAKINDLTGAVITLAIILAVVVFGFVAFVIFFLRRFHGRWGTPSDTADEQTMLNLLPDSGVQQSETAAVSKNNGTVSKANGWNKPSFLVSEGTRDEDFTLDLNKKRVCCFDKLRELFYVVSVDSNSRYTISVYDAKFRRQYADDIRDAGKPCALAASDKHGCLYVGDRDNRCLWKYTPDPSPQNRSFDKWLHFEDEHEKPLSLFSTSDGRLLVLLAVSNNDGHCWRGRLAIIAARKDREKIVDIQDDIVNPRSAIMRTTDHVDTFLVSYGLCGPDPGSGVCEIDEKGKVVMRCSDVQLHLPACLHYRTPFGDCCFVADMMNSRVLLLNRSLIVKRQVASWEPRRDAGSEGTHPCQIHFDSKTGQLIVGLQNGEVELYTLTDLAKVFNPGAPRQLKYTPFLRSLSTPESSAGDSGI